MYGYYNNTGTGTPAVTGNVGLSGQFLGIPLIYWIGGAVLWYTLKKK